MRVTIYDKNPGPGLGQWFLKLSWMVGCWIQRLFGAVDQTKGFDSWDAAIAWLKDRPGSIASLQFWGHGSPGAVYMAGREAPTLLWLQLSGKLTTASVIWFRACSVFQGESGYAFSKVLANGLNCTIAAHTRIVGFFQGGLYTRKPNTEPSWPKEEGELPGRLARLGLRWGNRTVICFATKIPAGW